MLADELKIGEKVIISIGGHVEKYSTGTVLKITEKRKDITIDFQRRYQNTFDSNGWQKTSGRWDYHDQILKATKENIEEYNKYKRKCKVDFFIRNFDLKDETMIDKMYEFILKVKGE